MISNKHQLPQQLLQQCSTYEQLLLQRYSQKAYVSPEDYDYLVEVRRYRASKDYEFYDLVALHEPMDLQLHKQEVYQHFYLDRPTKDYPFVGKYQQNPSDYFPALHEWYINTASEYDVEEETMQQSWQKLEAKLDDTEWNYHVTRGHHSPGHNNNPSLINKAFRWADEDNGCQTFQAKDDE